MFARILLSLAGSLLLLVVPRGANAQEAAKLGDPAIAHIAVTANTIDADIARLAEGRTTNDDVLAFARVMISTHTAVNEKAAALAKRLGVTPQDNDVSRTLNQGAEEAKKKLSSLQGAAFDAAYLQREVEFHQAVLDALDQTLIPGASNAELKALLQEVRPVVAAHLENAKALQKGGTTAHR